MNKTSVPSGANQGPIRRLMIFLALVYVAEGLGQVAGLINQPLTFYLKTVLGWAPDRVTEFLSILVIPWVIKPLYGLVSDFIPLFGYRRKTYLFLANLLAVGAFLWMMHVTDAEQILTGLMLTSIGMAASSTLCGAVMVENGKKYSLSGTFVNQQWLFFYLASVGTSFFGGWLTQHLDATSAFHTAALIVAFAPIGVMLGCWFLISEEKAQINVAALKTSTRALFKTFKSRVLWVVGGFLFFYNFSPGFGTPLYYYEVDHLHFSQEFIGTLGAIGACGAILGAFIYLWLQKQMNLRTLLYLSIFLGVLTQGAYVFLHGPISAIVLGIANGIAAMIALVASLTLAADYCPDGSEGFAYAAMMSISNLAGQLSANVGAVMYVHVFHSKLNPLILVSAAVTGLVVFLVPLLKLGNKKAGEKAKLE